MAMLMKKLTFATAVTLSSIVLVACGGGSGSNDSTSGSSDSKNSNPALSELDQAKNLIRTAKLFVSDMNAVEKAYENASNILQAKQKDRLSSAIAIPDIIHQYMRENKKSTLTVNDIEAINKEIIADDWSDEQLTFHPVGNFSASLNSDDTLKINGKLKADYKLYSFSWRWDTVSNTTKMSRKLIENDGFDIVYTNFEDDLTSSNKSKKQDLSFGFDKIEIGTGSDKITLTAQQNALKATGVMTEAVTINDEFSFSAAEKQGIAVDKGTVTLSNLVLRANDSVIEAKKISISVLDISNEVNGNKLVRTVPYSFALEGHMVKEVPKTDANINVNLIAKESDVENILELEEGGHVKEKSGKYLPMVALLNIKGNVTKKAGTVIPMNFQASLERDISAGITLKNLFANVEGKPLTITGNAKLSDENKMKESRFIIKQNNAEVSIKTDEKGKLVSSNNGKISDVMVNGTDYGDVFDTGSMVTAKFTDNSTIAF